MRRRLALHPWSRACFCPRLSYGCEDHIRIAGSRRIKVIVLGDNVSPTRLFSDKKIKLSVNYGAAPRPVLIGRKGESFFPRRPVGRGVSNAIWVVPVKASGRKSDRGVAASGYRHEGRTLPCDCVGEFSADHSPIPVVLDEYIDGSVLVLVGHVSRAGVNVWHICIVFQAQALPFKQALIARSPLSDFGLVSRLFNLLVGSYGLLMREDRAKPRNTQRRYSGHCSDFVDDGASLPCLSQAHEAKVSSYTGITILTFTRVGRRVPPKGLKALSSTHTSVPTHEVCGSLLQISNAHTGAESSASAAWR